MRASAVSIHRLNRGCQIQTVLTVIFCLVLLGVVAFLATRDVKDVQAFRAEATAQFNAWLGTQAASQLGLKPGNCEVVKQSETVGQDRGGNVYSYTLTLFVRSSAGQYVMFKSAPQKPYVKLVEPSVAKAVLKEKYLPRVGG